MFITRLLSGIVLVAGFILLFYFGGIALCIAIMFLSLVGTFELMRVFKMEKTPLAVLSYIFAAGYPLYLFFFGFSYSIFFFLGVVIIDLIIYVFSYPRFNVEHTAKAVFAFFYVPFMLGFVFLTRALPTGALLVWLIIFSSWGCDTCAYCVGKLIGKHKMTPVLSPKKSVEGAIGGIAGSIVLTLIYCNIFKEGLGLDTAGIAVISVLSGVAAFVSMIGDLAASAIKRNMDIKDYGRLIPGHGGVLDRFDSVIITAPIIFTLGYFFG